MKNVVLALCALLIAGCATVPSGKPDPRDPWEGFNRASYKFNDALDRAVAKPVAKGYKKVTPKFVRTGISNFFANLDTVPTIINDVLQGKIKQAGHDSGRFLLNSTVGLGGLFDPASAAGMERNDEDFGQTLGKWGVKSGPYLMLPVLGPSTVRDAMAKPVDSYSSPLTYLQDDSTRYIIRGIEVIDLRADLLSLDAQIEGSYDKYAFIRNAWLQRREYLVTDGQAGDVSSELEEGMDVDPADEAKPGPADPAQPPPDGSTPDPKSETPPPAN
ncbi:MAG TPA: VacJ family lipoprotein [Steroidobacteraceae bacterium]|nr:VacJ family lipoprotein [Steroidobacteraceae bacterium]